MTELRYQNPKADGHKDLVVWQKSIAAAKSIYALTSRFPPDERFGLRSQLQRAVVSVPTYIAEGKGRGSNKDYAQFVAVARGFLMEAETCILLAIRRIHRTCANH